MFSLSQKTTKHHRAAPGDARNSLAQLTLDRQTMRTPKVAAALHIRNW
jgi:hypothetical protein